MVGCAVCSTNGWDHTSRWNLARALSRRRPGLIGRLDNLLELPAPGCEGTEKGREVVFMSRGRSAQGGHRSRSKPRDPLYAEVELTLDLDNDLLPFRHIMVIPESRNDTRNISYFDIYDTLPELQQHSCTLWDQVDESSIKNSGSVALALPVTPQRDSPPSYTLALRHICCPRRQGPRQQASHTTQRRRDLEGEVNRAA